MADNNMKKIPPIENPELEKAIADMKGDITKEKQAVFAEALKTARLLAPCDFDVDIKPGKEQKIHPSQIKFYLINTNDGKTFFPAFTNIEHSTKIRFGKDIHPKNVVRNIKEYAPLMADERNKAQGVVINPGIDNIVVPKNMIMALAGRRPAGAPLQNRAPLNFTYGEPSVYPTRMVNAVYECVEKIPEIHRVWLRGKFAGRAMILLFVVDTDKQDEAVLNKIREVAVPQSKDVPVEVIFWNEEVNRTIIKESVPLYDDALEL
jgi:hypothetical protein